MTRIRYAPKALVDFDRIVDFLSESGAGSPETVGETVIAAIQILAEHPLIGRRADSGLRELVISRGKTGYVALYRFDVATDTITVLALRHQREVGVR